MASSNKKPFEELGTAFLQEVSEKESDCLEASGS